LKDYRLLLLGISQKSGWYFGWRDWLSISTLWVSQKSASYCGWRDCQLQLFDAIQKSGCYCSWRDCGLPLPRVSQKCRGGSRISI
jgi:hypothetical protein